MRQSGLLLTQSACISAYNTVMHIAAFLSCALRLLCVWFLTSAVCHDAVAAVHTASASSRLSCTGSSTSALTSASTGSCGSSSRGDSSGPGFIRQEDSNSCEQARCGCTSQGIRHTSTRRTNRSRCPSRWWWKQAASYSHSHSLSSGYAVALHLHAAHPCIITEAPADAPSCTPIPWGPTDSTEEEHSEAHALRTSCYRPKSSERRGGRLETWSKGRAWGQPREWKGTHDLQGVAEAAAGSRGSWSKRGRGGGWLNPVACRRC